MPRFPFFLSVVLLARNQGPRLEGILRGVTNQLCGCVSDYELIVVDNASSDQSVDILRGLIAPNGLPNLQVYALTKEVAYETAAWAGIENALGDFVAVVDPISDDLAFLPEMLDQAVSGADVVFANNQRKPPQSIAYRAARAVFNSIYKTFNGIEVAKETPSYQVLSKRVISFILQHPQPQVVYRHLAATAGFARVNLEYSAAPLEQEPKGLGESIDRGMRLLVSTTEGPMRLVTRLSLFGAAANLLYSIYVVAVGLMKADVAPGWVSLSLQQSGMFFLISLVLLVLGEYVLQMARLASEGPLYHVGQEFSSARITRTERLNIEDASAPMSIGSSDADRCSGGS